MSELPVKLKLNGFTRFHYQITCSYCGNTSWKPECEIKRSERRKEKKLFCNKNCYYNSRKTLENVNCITCHVSFTKSPGQIKKSPNHFCSKSCSATFNNKNKKFGTRRSKIEILIEAEVMKTYPGINLLCNSKEMIGSELDFYFPEYNFAIQINGILHYQPIYGIEKLNKIIKLDNEKRSRCTELGINLFEMNFSSDSYLSKEVISKRLREVIDLIESIRSGHDIEFRTQ